MLKPLPRIYSGDTMDLLRNKSGQDMLKKLAVPHLTSSQKDSLHECDRLTNEPLMAWQIL